MSLCESPEILSENHDKKALSSLSHTNVLPSSSFRRSLPSWCVRSLERLSIKFTSVGKKTRICTTWPSFPFTCRLLFIISTHKLLVSWNFLSIRIVLSCFGLFIFYFEKFSAWIWHLPFAIYVKLKLSSIIINITTLIIITSLPADVLWGFVCNAFISPPRTECVTNEPQRTSAGRLHHTLRASSIIIIINISYQHHCHPSWHAEHITEQWTDLIINFWDIDNAHIFVVFIVPSPISASRTCGTLL